MIVNKQIACPTCHCSIENIALIETLPNDASLIAFCPVCSTLIEYSTSGVRKLTLKEVKDTHAELLNKAEICYTQQVVGALALVAIAERQLMKDVALYN